MRRAVVALMLTGSVLVNIGCAVNHVDRPGPGSPGTVEFIGDVVYLSVEGGFHGIITRKGRRLNPVNLNESLQREGVVVAGAYQVREDIAGIRQWGTIVELVHQRRIR